MDNKLTILRMESTLCIFLALVWKVSAKSFEEHCTRPVMNSSDVVTLKLNNSVNVYRITEFVNVTVFSCHCIEVNKYSLCQNEVHQSRIDRVLQKSYFDFTQNCIKAFSEDRYINIDGKDVYKQNGEYTSHQQHNCSEEGLRINEKNVTVIVKSYMTKADLEEDRIVLRSGFVCKYSFGFCYDPKESIEVTWDLHQKNSSSFCNRTFSRVPFNTSNSYYLTLGDKKYLISENNDEYTAIELKQETELDCGVMTNIPGIIISNKIDAKPGWDRPLTRDDHGVFYFKKKQSLFEFITNRCRAGSDVALQLFEKDFALRERAAEADSNLILLQEEVDDLRKWFRIILIALCAVCAATLSILLSVTLLFCKVMKVYQLVNNAQSVKYPHWVRRFILEKQYGDVQLNRILNQAARGERRNSNTYETVTSEYDFNVLYKSNTEQT